jgi:hypothetical protein
MTTSIFYVYEHWRLDRDECFYVGKGKGIRAYKMRDRNAHHRAIMAKLSREGSGMEVRMVATGLAEDEAFALEVERIAFWREAGADLANRTDGGDGVSGLKMSDEAKDKMAAAKIGTKQSPETIAKRIAPLVGRKQPRHAVEICAEKRRGKALSEEHKAKLSAAHMGKTVSDAARASLSAANKGKPWSEKRRAAEDAKRAT